MTSIGFRAGPRAAASRGDARRPCRFSAITGFARFAALLAVLLGGCQLLDRRPPDQPDIPPAPESPEQEPVSAPEPEPDVSTAIDLLQQGRGDEAGALLDELAGGGPESALIAKLRRQLEAPIEDLLPGPYRRVEVRAGDTLSGIALRALGDPMMFYALARLNGIEVPAQLAVGTELRLPRQDDAESGESEAVEERQPDESGAVETVAEYLALSGEPEEALRMLIMAVEDDPGPSPASGLLVELSLQRSAALASDGDHESALQVINDALAVVTRTGAQKRLTEARTRRRAEILHRQARDLRNSGDIHQAHEMAVEAAETDPSFTPAAGLAEELKAERVDSLHNDALVAWRNRNVDLAIRNWEALLGIAPDFEPARIYLDRARRLRARLGQP